MSSIVTLAHVASNIIYPIFFLLNLLNIGFIIIIQLNYIWTIRRSRVVAPKNLGVDATDRPFISVHVPCYDEPAAVLETTLRSLAKLDYPRYEVVVLDNNTPSPDTWVPVQQTCRELGDRFRFYHFDNVKGAKAGALNIGLGLCSPETRYVAVVDADYQVCPDFLKRAVQMLKGNDAAFVQFPQAYRNVSGAASYIEDELSDYFRTFAPHANSDDAMLLTGTLSVIDIDRLRAIGGWNGSTVTEDAELGVRFFENRYFGVYDPTIVGRGMLPLSFESLKVQRRRWAIGNLQTLTDMIRRGVLRPRSAGFCTLVAQLTAWPAFWFVPVLSLLLFSFVDGNDGSIGVTETIAACAILLSSACVFLRLLMDRSSRMTSIRQVALVFLVKLSLVWVSSTAFFPVMRQSTVAFARTPKLTSSLKSGLGNLRLDANLVLGALGIFGVIAYAAAGNWAAASACCLIACIAPSAFWVDRSLRHYAMTVAAPAAKIRD